MRKLMLNRHLVEINKDLDLICYHYDDEYLAEAVRKHFKIKETPPPSFVWTTDAKGDQK